MEFMSMSTRGGIRNGAAIAAALFAGAGKLDAQQPASTRPRDSAVVVRVFAPNAIPLDSLRALLQEFDRERVGTQRWVALTGRIDSLFHISVGPNSNMLVRRVLTGEARGAQPSWNRLGWLGLSTQGPNQQLNMNGEVFVTQFAYPKIVTVDPQSPAEKAGIMAGDILVAYNGVDVVNREFNLTTLLKPDSKITVTVRRDGETKDYQLVVAKTPRRIAERREFETTMAASAAGPVTRVEIPDGAQTLLPSGPVFRVPRTGFSTAGSPIVMLATNGVFGASLSTVNAELARVLNLRAGVLVTDVPEETPAFRAGLRTGDVIISVGDQPVISLLELRQRVAALTREHSIELQVASRNQKPRTLTISLTPPAPPSP
jgi:predicted metalloprotease with PDZ domain